MNWYFKAEFLEEHRRVLESRLQPVIREITDSRAKTKEDLETLYRKIVSAILLRSGLGSPTDISVVREATGRFNVQKLYLVKFLHKKLPYKVFSLLLSLELLCL